MQYFPTRVLAQIPTEVMEETIN